MTYRHGQNYSGFILEHYQHIEEISSDVFLFRHAVLGCPLLAIKNADPNKTFSVAFNTTPSDSTGVAHILEHSVLMGSKKYPIKDVFGEIHKGGLMTFLNAMTGADLTYYPFATRNLKEYFSLMDVYCDVVFNPLLLKTTFEQEGWHYHQEGSDSPLEFQGVVYNEMKGAFSDPVRLIFHHIYGGLMPGSTYAHESGGDPANIPDLSYEEFCQFHQDHYHPSNSMFFVYGDAELADELAFIQDNFLHKFEQPVPPSVIVPGSEISEPIFIRDRYAVDSTDIAKKTYLAVGTQVCTVLERQENMAFQVIANILYNSDASPLKNAIVSSGLCKDFGGLYLSSSSLKTIMVTYLVGSEEEKRDEFLRLYADSLNSMVKNGLDKELVLAELNKYEFSLREEGSKAQRGLDLIGKATVALKYGADPFASLVNEQLIQAIRQKALHENYFEHLIERYLLNAVQTVTICLVPDPAKQAETQKAEQERLDQFAATLSSEEKQQIVDRTNQLQQEQLQPNSEDTLRLLPQLTLTDLESRISFHEARPVSMFGHSVILNELPTNHISYIDIGFDLRSLPQSLLPFLDVFGAVVTEIGTKRLNYMQFAKEINTCTGNFSHSLTTYTRRQEPGQTKPVFWLHLKCLPDYLVQAVELVAEVLRDVSFADRRRIQEIVGREFAWAEHSVHSEGYSLASSRVFAHLSEAGCYNEYFHGVTSYLALKDLALNYSAREEEFLAILEKIASMLFKEKNLLLAMTAGKKEIDLFSRAGQCLPAALSPQPVVHCQLQPVQFPDHEAFITSAEIVFATQGGNLFRGGNGYSGHFEVLKTYLSRDYLWNTVRQMGGAYGCFIQFSQVTGNIVFISYRDPQVQKTYDAYAAIPEVLSGLSLAPRTMEQLIIGTYGSYDPHQSPAAKGATARNEYLSGITAEDKKRHLQEIIATQPQHLHSMAPLFAEMLSKSHRATIGNRSRIERDSHLFTQLSEL